MFFCVYWWLNVMNWWDFEIDTFSESPYIEIDSLSEPLIPHTKKFSVLSVNIQSINAKFDKLLALITDLNDINFMLSAICIKESWLKKGQDIFLFQIPGYNLIIQPKVCSEHGGLIAYFKREREYTLNVKIIRYLGRSPPPTHTHTHTQGKLACHIHRGFQHKFVRNEHSNKVSSLIWPICN